MKNLRNLILLISKYSIITMGRVFVVIYLPHFFLFPELHIDTRDPLQIFCFVI